MTLNIDNLIQTSVGVTLSTLSVSGLMCINTLCSRTRSNTNSSSNCSCLPNQIHLDFIAQELISILD